MDWDYIIVGSGFGGSVSALRLVQKGYRVLMLEKGRRLEAADFPKTSTPTAWGCTTSLRPASSRHSTWSATPRLSVPADRPCLPASFGARFPPQNQPELLYRPPWLMPLRVRWVFRST